jgi:lytic murein transglycosylase
MRPIALCGALVLCAPSAFAAPPETSLRPVGRDAPPPVRDEIVSRAALTLDAAARAPRLSLRPHARPATLRVAPAGPDLAPRTEAAFRRWVADFRSRALDRGIARATFDAAFRDVRYDPQAVRRDASQAEFTRTIGDYLSSAVSDTRIGTGRAMLREHAALLRRIEARYGVDRHVVLAIWGMESAYGVHRGSSRVIDSMATLAFDGRRRSFFERELVAALQILQAGHTTPAAMRGSWAGAMGHTQFMPSSFNALAVDFTGDGRRDIWGENPADALASTANYLAENGWISGQPWAVEVTLPRGFDFAQSGKQTRRMPSDWARLGVLGTDGRPVRDYGSASVFLPAGAQGPAFLIFRNFAVIARYNPADAYVMGVGHLADRLRGQGPFNASWPDEPRALTRDERAELQRRLTVRGFDTRGIDGRIGPNSMRALRAWQRAAGLVPDGHASLTVLERLRDG